MRKKKNYSEDIKKVRDLGKELMKTEQLSKDDFASIDRQEADDVEENPMDKHGPKQKEKRRRIC